MSCSYIFGVDKFSVYYILNSNVFLIFGFMIGIFLVDFAFLLVVLLFILFVLGTNNYIT